jgi:hypothetical protein
MFVPARGGVDAMVGRSAKAMTVSLVVLGTLSVPAIGSAQHYRDRDDNRQSVVVKCASGQRAVMEQRRSYRGSRVVARCVGSPRTVNDSYGRRIYARDAGYDTYRPARSRYYEHRPRRSKTRSALMIAGSAATGAGIGGAFKGKKGALVGAAIGGGTASIYEAAKRR